jgi:hypothetical protein
MQGRPRLGGRLKSSRCCGSQRASVSFHVLLNSLLGSAVSCYLGQRTMMICSGPWAIAHESFVLEYVDCGEFPLVRLCLGSGSGEGVYIYRCHCSWRALDAQMRRLTVPFMSKVFNILAD